MGQFEQRFANKPFYKKWAEFTVTSDFYLLFKSLPKLRLDPKSQNLAFHKALWPFVKDLSPLVLYSVCFGKLSLVSSKNSYHPMHPNRVIAVDKKCTLLDL